MTFPASIRVGYRDFRIEPWPAREASANQKFGEYCHTTGVIRVRADLEPQIVGMLMLHEVLHAAWDVGELPSADEEKTVSALANQLAQIIRDNPDFVEFVSRALRPVQGE